MSKTIRRKGALKREGGLLPDTPCKNPVISRRGDIDLGRSGVRRHMLRPPHPPYPDGPPTEEELEAQQADRQLFRRFLREARAELHKKHRTRLKQFQESATKLANLRDSIEKQAYRLAGERMDIRKGKRSSSRRQSTQKGQASLLDRLHSGTLSPDQLEYLREHTIVENGGDTAYQRALGTSAKRQNALSRQGETSESASGKDSAPVTQELPVKVRARFGCDSGEKRKAKEATRRFVCSQEGWSMVMQVSGKNRKAADGCWHLRARGLDADGDRVVLNVVVTPDFVVKRTGK